MQQSKFVHPATAGDHQGTEGTAANLLDAMFGQRTLDQGGDGHVFAMGLPTLPFDVAATGVDVPKFSEEQGVGRPSRCGDDESTVERRQVGWFETGGGGRGGSQLTPPVVTPYVDAGGHDEGRGKTECCLYFSFVLRKISFSNFFFD